MASLSVFIIHFIQSFGYGAIFLLMTLESALIPIPSEVTMPFAGFFSQQGNLALPIIILVGAIGNLIGSLIAYAIGYFLEETVIVNLINKYGKILLLTKDDYLQSRNWFDKYGSSVVFFSRLLPGVRTFISLPAGLSEMNLTKFITFTFLGSLIWSAVLTYIGYYLGSNWEHLRVYYSKFEYLIIGLLLFGILYYINHKLHLLGHGQKTPDNIS